MYTKGKWEVKNTKEGPPPGYRHDIQSYDGWHVASIAGGADSNELENGTEELANAKLIAAAPDMADASRDFLDGWLHFCDCIDFAKSNLDADAIRFMNEVPGKIQIAYKAAIAKAK